MSKEKALRILLDFLVLSFAGLDQERRAVHVHKQKNNCINHDTTLKSATMNHSISCTYVGHATTIIKLGDCRFLTDPHFGKRVITQKRLTPLAVDPANLPDFDAILVSHAHADHFDVSSFKYLSCKTPIIVPEGKARRFSALFPNPIVELSHFANYELSCGIEVTAVPAVHSFCALLPCIPSKINSYIIRDKKTNTAVFFCGDSAYGPHFSEIGSLGKIDLAVLPIGSYSPSFIMKHNHMTPEEAVSAFKDLGAEKMVPSHFGTFQLSLECADAPEKKLLSLMELQPELKDKVCILKSGETLDL